MGGGGGSRQDLLHARSALCFGGEGPDWPSYADNRKKSTIYAVRKLLGLKVRLAQGMIGREWLRYLLASLLK